MLLASWLGTILGGASLSAHAAQWFIQPDLRVQSFYDDNVRLSVHRQTATGGLILDAGLTSGWRTETAQLRTGARLWSSNYFNDSDYDRTNGELNANAAYRWGRHRFGLAGEFNYDDTLTSELSTTGYTRENKRRRRLSVIPSWHVDLTERLNADLQYSHQDVSYEDAKRTSLYDYQFSRGALTLGYQLSERAGTMARVSYDRYEADAVGSSSRTQGLEAGISYAWSETLSTTLFAGVRRTESETQTFRRHESSGPLVDLSLTKRLPLGRFDFSLGRSLLPSSDADLLDTTSLSVGYERPLSERLHFNLDASGYRNRNPGGETSGNDRDYYSIQTGLRYRIDRAFSVDLKYRLRWQQRERLDDEATSNAIFLNLNYRMPLESVSRWSALE